MNWNEWKSYYQLIIKKLKIDSSLDENSAQILNSLLDQKVNKELVETDLKELIANSNAFIFGCGPSLRKMVKQLKKTNLEGINIAADGAISALLEYNIFCHINVSDLDGNIKDSLKANSNGTITIIHAHGDNIPLIKEYTPKFTKKILGSVQVKPFGNLVNYGGFTDGDRGIFLAENFNCKRIILVGFDFGFTVGEYSKPSLGEHIAGKNKTIKLEFASFLISEILKKNDIEIFSLSTNSNIKGVKSISVEKLKKLLKK